MVTNAEIQDETNEIYGIAAKITEKSFADMRKEDANLAFTFMLSPDTAGKYYLVCFFCALEIAAKKKGNAILAQFAKCSLESIEAFAKTIKNMKGKK